MEQEKPVSAITKNKSKQANRYGKGTKNYSKNYQSPLSWEKKQEVYHKSDEKPLNDYEEQSIFRNQVWKRLLKYESREARHGLPTEELIQRLAFHEKQRNGENRQEGMDSK